MKKYTKNLDLFRYHLNENGVEYDDDGDSIAIHDDEDADAILGMILKTLLWRSTLREHEAYIALVELQEILSAEVIYEHLDLAVELWREIEGMRNIPKLHDSSLKTRFICVMALDGAVGPEKFGAFKMIFGEEN